MIRGGSKREKRIEEREIQMRGEVKRKGEQVK